MRIESLDDLELVVTFKEPQPYREHGRHLRGSLMTVSFEMSTL
jgi:hypothetical protein